MMTQPTDPSPQLESHAQVVERACARIAPTWPLDRFIAVNPLWERIDAPLPAVAAQLAALSGARLLMPGAWYREQWRAGRLRPEHLDAAIAEAGSAATTAELCTLLAASSADDDAPAGRRLSVMDVVDQRRDLVHGMAWRDFIVHSVSQLCAWYFDDEQASRDDEGLYAHWRRQALQDRSPRLLMGLRGYEALARGLPETAAGVLAQAFAELEVPDDERERYLSGLLLDLNGWASWCAYRRWTARLAEGDDHQIRELLAIRVAWECLLLRAGGRELASRWRVAMAAWPQLDVAARGAQTDRWLLQRALEFAWQQPLVAQLVAGRQTGAPTAPAVQAVFCIDVRSEVLRRGLEAASRRVQTLGFAGFFGLPIEYQPYGAAAARPQLPGLLAPQLRVTDVGVEAPIVRRRTERLAEQATWKQWATGAISSFSFVESVGPLFAGRLLASAFARGEPELAEMSADDRARKPRLTATHGGEPLGPERRAELAAGVLRAMSLTRNFARLVVLVGHGSETRNNPHAAGLDCGACCGQTGEVNARAAAALFNAPEVRAGLAARGIDVPASTHFMAALHNTTTDEVQLYDLDELPPAHASDVAELRSWFAAASDRARAERAPRLGIDAMSPASLRAEVKARTRNWAELRPEWGLADNAALIVAPREHTCHLDLAGRAFLHEYRHEEDVGSAILEIIMTAPMLVAHWINFQYYASTVDNDRYGSGNKVLHNVVGGHIGVFEGNGGDLRIGLPLQSLHDGQRFVHTPLRLNVFIAAPRAAIAAILDKHEKLRQLVENQWLFLFQFDPAEREVYIYRDRGWTDATVRPGAPGGG